MEHCWLCIEPNGNRIAVFKNKDEAFKILECLNRSFPAGSPFYITDEDAETPEKWLGINKSESPKPTNYLQIVMDLDKDQLAQEITAKVENDLTTEFRASARDLIMKDTGWSSYYGTTRYSKAEKSEVKPWVIELIKDGMEPYRNDIVKAAAHELAESMRRSSKIRNEFENLLNGEVIEWLKEILNKLEDEQK